MKKYTLRHLIVAGIGLLILVVVMYSAIVLRDYRIEIDDGIRLVARTPVPMAPGFAVDASIPKKLRITISPVSGASGYEIQISGNKNMFLGKTYKSVLTTKELGKLRGGKEYYIRTRSYKLNEKGRNVNGRWGGIRKVVVKK